jgi:phage-related protein
LAHACHELRVNDANKTWRLIYRIDDDAVVVLDVFEKKTRAIPRRLITECQRRRRLYDQAAGD